MTIEEVVNLFINDTLTGDIEQERTALLGYEAHKERETVLRNGNVVFTEKFYKEYAQRFTNRVRVLCLIRQYEEYVAQLQLTVLN